MKQKDLYAHLKAARDAFVSQCPPYARDVAILAWDDGAKTAIAELLVELRAEVKRLADINAYERRSK